MAPNRRMINSLLQRSLEMRNTLCATSESHLLAKIVASFPANVALATGNPYFQGYSVADGKAIDLRANAHYYTGRFMTKGQRCASTEITVGELLVVAYIRSADAS